VVNEVERSGREERYDFVIVLYQRLSGGTEKNCGSIRKATVYQIYNQVPQFQIKKRQLLICRPLF
jgi:hypothetical protein